MIHPPDVVGKYAPDAIIGPLKEGGGGDAPAAGGGASAPLLNKGAAAKEYESPSKKIRMQGEGKIGGWLGALIYMALNFMKEIVFTIFSQKNFAFTGDRLALTRSAIFLFVFIVIHAIGNLHVFLGPDDFNGYGYFYVRLYWTGFGFQANIVELYVLLAAVLHVMVALKRTWDISLNMAVSSGKMNLAFSGITLLVFMTIHLFQFRFGETQPYLIRPPPYLINFEGILSLNLFWTWDTSITPVPVRDIYLLEFTIFKSLKWCLFYSFSVIIFSIHACLGWQKVVGAASMEIPKKFQAKAVHVGYAFTAFVALLYLSFPIYGHLATPSKGWMGAV